MKTNHLHNSALFILPIICIIQAYFGLTSGGLDIIFLVLLVVIVRRFIGNTLLVDDLSVLLMLIIVFALLTMLTFSITQTSWINVFRSNLFMVIIYLYTLNYSNKINVNILKIPFVLINIFNIWVLQKTWSLGFTHHSLDLSYFNLNNIGIISLLILLMSLILDLKQNKISVLGMMNIAISTIIVLLSFSRANYLMLSFVVLFLILFVFNMKNNIKFFILTALALILFFSQDFNSSVLDYGFAFLDKKVNVGTPSEILFNRFYDIAILPIDLYLKDRDYFYIFLGGGLIPEHSLLVTHITCFGLFSMMLYLLVTIDSVRGLIHKNNTIKITALMMLLLFLNDSSTNASTYIAFVKLLPFAVLGLIRGENIEKHRKFGW